MLANNIIVAAMNSKADTLSKVATPAIPQAANDDLTILLGTREKQRILEAYKGQFGLVYPNSIVMSKKGMLVSTTIDLPSTCMRPSKGKFN